MSDKIFLTILAAAAVAVALLILSDASKSEPPPCVPEIGIVDRDLSQRH